MPVVHLNKFLDCCLESIACSPCSPRRQTGLHPKSHVPARAPPPVLPGGQTLRASLSAIDSKRQFNLWHVTVFTSTYMFMYLSVFLSVCQSLWLSIYHEYTVVRVCLFMFA